MLTQRLKELESKGLVDRTVIPSSPVQVEYSLTEKGRQLIPLMKGIAEWAHRWADAPVKEPISKK
jgi:DNA-binding HxlR family transcriptional regulator